MSNVELTRNGRTRYPVRAVGSSMRIENPPITPGGKAWNSLAVVNSLCNWDGTGMELVVKTAMLSSLRGGLFDSQSLRSFFHVPFLPSLLG